MGHTTKQPASDQRHEGQGVPLTRSLETLLTQEPDATTTRVLEILAEECIKPSVAYRCMNPECDAVCNWPRGRGGGRPQRFCSRRCRQIYDRVRARLRWEVDELLEITTRDAVTKRQREVLERHIGQRRWALDRYPKWPPPPPDRVKRSERENR